MCGLPIIVSDAYPEKEFTNARNSLAYRYDDHVDLAQKIQYLFDNPPIMLDLSKKSIETAVSYFSESPFNLLASLYLHFKTHG